MNKGIYRPVQPPMCSRWRTVRGPMILAMSKDTYTDRYEMMPDGLSEYLITKDTILNAEFVGEENGNIPIRMN